MGWIRADEVDSERLYLECKGDRGWIYRDGSNYFNFIISHTGSEMTMEQESIEAIRGILQTETLSMVRAGRV